MVIRGSETPNFFSFAKAKEKGQKALMANLKEFQETYTDTGPYF